MEQESGAPKISGLVVNDYSIVHSRKTSTQSLQEYLEAHGIVGISNVDTRMIVRHVRDKGAMNCMISSEELDPAVLSKKLKEVPGMAGLELSSSVSTSAPYFVGDEQAAMKVAVLDLGIKSSILKHLTRRGCYCKVFPAKTPFRELEDWEPHGYFLSNGPGDPAAMDYAVETVKEILNAGKPIFGICLGHQILALASGISTFKMHHGHRGLNHPIKNLDKDFCEVTSQNHGFCVSKEDIEKNDEIEVTHVNLNDHTVAGIRLKNNPAFSVQYHPESSPGPHDSRYLFDDFVQLMSNR
jgi:carbamoyl-phosphate synthase small subunit